jgi:hypothetical protein
VKNSPGQEAQVMMEAEDQTKKPYSSPTVKKLTPEQAKKLVADRNNCSEEEAADFLNALRKQQQNNATDQKRKRST